LIDLHLHTTASDGTLTPRELVARVVRAGIRVLSVTDHDTMAGVVETAETAAAQGLDVLPGIEITAVLDQRDVHVLGYFLEAAPPSLDAFLVAQRADRVTRVKKMGALLAGFGMPIDIDRLIEVGRVERRSLARPLVARALASAGHVTSVQEAFDRWIGDGRPAYVPRQGAAPAEVARIIARAGGVAALAHPGLLGRDDLIPDLVKAGLAAIEVYHAEHDAAAETRYLGVARRHDLAVTGGSDYHGEDHHRAAKLGHVGISRAQFDALVERITRARARQKLAP
jgi:predicted metal-dependent phosphoesterase TrpH